MTLLHGQPAGFPAQPRGCVVPAPEESEFREMHDQGAFGDGFFAFASENKPDHADRPSSDLKAEPGQGNLQNTGQFLDLRLACKKTRLFQCDLPSLGGEAYQHNYGLHSVFLTTHTENRPAHREYADRPAAARNPATGRAGQHSQLTQFYLNPKSSRLTRLRTIRASRLHQFPIRGICGCREAPRTTSSCFGSLTPTGIVTGTPRYSCWKTGVGAACRNTAASPLVPSNFLRRAPSRRAETTAGRAPPCGSQPSPFTAHLLPRPTVADVSNPQIVQAIGQAGSGIRHYFIREAPKASPAPVNQIENFAHLASASVSSLTIRNIDRSAWHECPQIRDRSSNECR